MKRLLITIAAVLLTAFIINIFLDIEVGLSQSSGYPSPFVRMRIKSNFITDAPVSGEDAFTTTAIRDTVTVSGAATTDYYVISTKNDTSAAQMSYISATGSLIVLRKAGGTSALAYSWFRIRPSGQ